ncbi:FkbM family methyltransferase [Paenibacillus sp. ACRRX]|uniref:FkbM family methyltransferase n=1 Tax=Paenibacillus sp. ACRRX TaxID=2918206 RepID=UPI001EF4F0AC|nr:FkbM family methyltransferase [Paenibacillus sp. ACRRX]MCG7409947.1 FkbM family methyltransferase [Paenibacillus sp. ACRRX]
MDACYIGNQRMLLKTGYGGLLICPSDDLSLMPFLALTGVFESPLTNYFSRMVKPGQVVVDVGANIGYFSVLLGHLIGQTGHLYAYEANPHLLHFLNDNLSLNYLHDRTQVRQEAVYHEPGDVTFHIAKRFMGNSSIREHDQSYNQHYTDEFEIVSVKAAVLDQELKHLPRIDWLKVDIEGGEYEAFLGMEQLLRNKVNVTVFEVNKAMMQHRWTAFTELLQKYHHDWGKSFYMLSQEGLPIPITLEQVIQDGNYPFVLMC